MQVQAGNPKVQETDLLVLRKGTRRRIGLAISAPKHFAKSGGKLIKCPSIDQGPLHTLLHRNDGRMMDVIVMGCIG